MSTINIQKELIEAINRLCSPIEFALQSDTNAKILFKSLGWDFDRIEGFPINDLINSLNDIYNLLEEVRLLLYNPPESLESFMDCLNLLSSLFSTISSISNFINNATGVGLTASFKSEFGKLAEDLINYLICGYLEVYHFRLYASLSVLGIITPRSTQEPTTSLSGDNEKWIRFPYEKSTIHLNNIIPLLSKPRAYFREQFYPASGVLDSGEEAQEYCDKLFPRLKLLFQSLYFDVIYGMTEESAPLYTSSAYSVMKRTMTIIYHSSDFSTFGASITVSPTMEGGHGLVVSLFGAWNYHSKLKDWLLKMEASASLDIFSIKNGAINFPSSFTDIDFKILFQLGKLSNNNALLGSVSGTRFDIKDVQISTFLNYISDKFSYGAEIELNKMEFNIGGEGDSFINKILPNGANGKFDLKFGWDSINGFHFNTSGGLIFNFPVHQKIGPVEFKGMTLGVYLENQSLSIKGGAGIALDLGVLALSVDNVGIKADITFPEANANLGVCNLDIGFKFPDGVALAINADPVKGGGFLNYDAATSTYTGGLELAFSKISFAAIGIISTKLPGGQKGYSLLIIITAEFSAIQLGMGFTLNGLGGLLGLNRTMNPDVLRAGIRDKTLDSILFPKDIINNKDTIISNIGQAFPAMEGQFMVGPMAKIGWGTPNILTIDLGIILEFPEPVRLAILGLLKAEWKASDKSILKLQVNFLGVIDFNAKYLSFDASIFDSKILTFPLMGDMALRLYWGDKPNFLLSVGGFHPRYTPPPLNLPEMRRLSLILADDKNLWIGIETYFAITSNSVQFGAKVEAKAKMWEGKLNVTGALWFDVLFKFNPFYFVADMGAQFAVRWKSKEILTIFINLMLEGPNPWRAQGKGTFKVLKIGVTVSFDKTFGKANAETIDPVALDAKFEEQLSHKDNWEALMPARSHQQVSWKENTTSDLIVDSGGSLRFSQKLLPLNVDMLKYGTAPISDTKRYQITKYELSQSGQTEVFNTPVAAKDLFARSEYFNMTDDEKLSKDSYESFESGVLVGSDKLSSGYAVHRKIEYEDIIIDTGFREPKPIKWQLLSGLMNVHLMDSYVSGSALSDFISVTNHNGPDKVAAINTIEERFVVVDSSNLSVVSQAFNSSAEADSFLAAQMQSNTAANEWFVANEFELL